MPSILEDFFQSNSLDIQRYRRSGWESIIDIAPLLSNQSSFFGFLQGLFWRIEILIYRTIPCLPEAYLTRLIVFNRISFLVRVNILAWLSDLDG